MKRKTAVFLAFLIVFGGYGAAYAEKPDIRLSAGIGYLQGDTTYQIGGNYTSTDPDDPSGEYHFPISELTFPLNVAVVSLDLAASYWRVSGNISYKTNISEPNGKMEDSDWLNPANPDQLNIYSESTIKADLRMFNADARFAFLKYPGWDLHVGLGYLQQNFNFNCYDVDQWYPSNPELPHEYVSGKIISYDSTFKVPYALLGVNFNTKKFKGNLTYSYSPFVTVDFTDKHLLRSIESKGYNDGSMNEIKFSGSYDFFKHWFAAISFDYINIDTDGYERQHHMTPYVDSKGEYHSDLWIDIDSTVTSEQLTSLLSIGYKF